MVDDDTLALSQEGPILVLAGMEASVMTLHHPPRPESMREFAKWVAGQFILCGPQEQKEGGSTAHTRGQSRQEQQAASHEHGHRQEQCRQH